MYREHLILRALQTLVAPGGQVDSTNGDEPVRRTQTPDVLLYIQLLTEKSGTHSLMCPPKQGPGKFLYLSALSSKITFSVKKTSAEISKISITLGRLEVSAEYQRSTLFKMLPAFLRKVTKIIEKRKPKTGYQWLKSAETHITIVYFQNFRP